ncbi:MAG: hypothetical protein ABTQ25_16370 [Nitrosomonas ureae]
MRTALISVQPSTASGVVRRLVLLLAVVAIAPLLGCGSFHALDIRSDPPHALVLSKNSLAPNAPPMVQGTTPVSTRFYFRSEEDPRNYEITVLMRGYEPAKVQVDFKSPKELDLTLQRIPEVNEFLFDPKTIPKLKLYLLPVSIQVNHVNDLSGKELAPDAEASKTVSEFLMNALPRLLPGTERAVLSSPAQEEWISTESDLKGFLERIDTRVFRYEARPMMAEREVKGFGTLRAALPVDADVVRGPPLLLHVSGVCHVATAEYLAKRAARQGLGIMMMALGAAFSPASSAAVGGPASVSGSAPTGKTKLRLAILDIKTSELLHVDDLVLGDCTKPEIFEAELAGVVQRMEAKNLVVK